MCVNLNFVAIITAINPKENNVTVVNSASGHCVTASTSNNGLSLTANSTDVVEPDQNRANAYFVSYWLLYIT